MMNIVAILLLTLLQFAAGFGLLTLCSIRLKTGLFLPLAILLGVAIFSIIPFLLQLLYVPVTSVSVFASIIVTTLLLNSKLLTGISQLRLMLNKSSFSIKLYEIPSLVVIGLVIFVSVWRCFYFPPTPRDLTSGAEVIAEYAIHEHTMINSVFTVNLESTNNPFKPPFVTSLQIIYKLAGFPFGQIWLSGLFISFICFLYHALSLTVHKLIAGLLIVFFLAIPEMYAYTFMVLFDYSNAVYFFLACFFLFLYFSNRQKNYLLLAGIIMGIATYVRSETLVIACFMVPCILWHHVKNKAGILHTAKAAGTFLAFAFLLYILSITVFINLYLPVKYNVQELVNTDLWNVSLLADRFINMNSKLIFSRNGITYYGYFIFIFLLLLLSEIVFKRKFGKHAKNWLFAILVIYLSYPVLGYLLPLLDIDNSTKRGLFKMFPLMLLYMANNNLVINLSAKISRWENGLKVVKG